jgi:DNA-binding FrmR family transcriptional regulator
MTAESGLGTKDMLSRLRKIEGQARGLQRMVEEGRDCEEIILQLSALRAAVNKVCMVVIAAHVEECLLNQARDENAKEALKKASRMFMKFSG